MNKNKEQEILQNLKDADCNSSVIEEFFKLAAEGNTKAMLRLLAKHRVELLDSLHESQKKIDCLDYLIFNLKQK